jgi:amino acid transporter
MAAKELERNLGLLATLAISTGAMIGSGIFILPGLALQIAGPAVIIAYLLAGLLVVPAALSKSEMATAMPESGGTYIFIERGMGPLLGTIAGIGTWFALAFKGGLALVGGAPYLILLFDLPQTAVALALAVVLVGINLLGAKQTGRVQVVLVAVLLLALVWFVAGGLPTVSSGRYEPFLTGGVGGLLEATGLVFVSYAGVTKITSIAEEIKNPGRNIPLGILGSLAFTTILYVLIVAVIVGVGPADQIAGSLTPMADAADLALGFAGVIAIVIAALLALVSTANAGILSSSRYPFAMSRDQLAPPSLGFVSERFKTPSLAITLTGVVLVFLILFVPVSEIAKLGSAFQIIVFVMLNIAVIAFRESDAELYEPTFKSPLYPWMQLFGAVGGIALLTQMGIVPLVGAVGITVGSVAWYFIYGRPRTDDTGVAVDAIRRSVGRRVANQTEYALNGNREGDDYTVLVALTEQMDEDRETVLLRLAADLVRQHDGHVTVLRFEEVPDQTPLPDAAETQSPDDITFEQRTDEIAADLDVPVEIGEIVSHDTKHAIVNYADHEEVDSILMDREATQLRSLILDDINWIMRHASADVFLVRNRGLEDIEEIAVITDRGPYDPVKIQVADTLAHETGATIRLLYAVDPETSQEHRKMIADYHTELEQSFSAPVSSEIIRTSNQVDELTTAAESADLLMIGADAGHRFRRILRESREERIADRLTHTSIEVHTPASRRSNVFSRLVNRFFF